MDTITFTNPEQNYAGAGGFSAAVPVQYFALSGEFDTVSIMVCFVRTNVMDTYIDEDADLTNALQLNSTADFKRDGVDWFEGSVVSKPLFRSYDQGNFLEVTMHGPDGQLSVSLVKDDTGLDVWSRVSTTVEVTDVPLEVSNAYGDFIGSTLWPDPLDLTIGADCWVKDSLANQDAISTGIGAGDAVPFFVNFSTTDKGMFPRGWLKLINGGGQVEFMYYDGLDNTGAGGVYRARVTARAELGTTARDFLIGDIGYNKLVKQMAPGIYKLSEDAVTLRLNKQFFPQYKLGCFLLSATATGTTYIGERYTIYDEDLVIDPGGTIYTIGDIITLMMLAGFDVGGPGFKAGDLDFDALNLGINRYDYSPEEKPEYLYTAIQDLLAVEGLGEQIKFWFSQRQRQFRLAIPSNGAVLVTLNHVERIEHNVSLDKVFSAVRVPYMDDQPSNRIDEQYAIHVGSAASGAKPDFWIRTTAGGKSWDRGTNTEDSNAADNNFGIDMLRDGKSFTKLTAYFEHDPGGEFPFGNYYFGPGTNPPALNLTEISMAVGNYRALDPTWGRSTVNDTFTYVAKVQGCDDYDSVAKTGTWVDLGFTVEGIAQVDGVPKLQTATGFAKRTVNAIRVVFEFMAGDKRYGDFYTAVLHDLVVKGDAVRYAYVQTSGTIQTQAEYVYAPDSHAKLRGGINADGAPGSPRVLQYDNIGASTEDAAITIARNVLKTKLVSYEERMYEYRGILNADQKPELNDTWTVQEDDATSYTGYIRAFTVVKAGNAQGGVEQSLRLKMFSSAVGVIT